MAPSAIWPEASILKELVREGENPQRTLGWGSSRDRDVLKSREQEPDPTMGITLVVEGARSGPQGGDHRGSGGQLLISALGYLPSASPPGAGSVGCVGVWTSMA